MKMDFFTFNLLLNELYKLKATTERPPAKMSGFRLNIQAVGKIALTSIIKHFDFTLQDVRLIIKDIEIYRRTGKFEQNIRKFTSKIGDLKKLSPAFAAYQNFTAEVKLVMYDSSLLPTDSKMIMSPAELKMLISEIEKCNTLG